MQRTWQPARLSRSRCSRCSGGRDGRTASRLRRDARRQLRQRAARRMARTRAGALVAPFRLRTSRSRTPSSSRSSARIRNGGAIASPACSPTPLSRALGGGSTRSVPKRARDQPVTRVSWFAAARILRKRRRAPADLVRMGIRGRGRRIARRRARRSGLARAAFSPGMRGRRTQALAASRRAQRTSTACATCTAWSGNGSTTSTRCWSAATTATRAIRTCLRFCGAGALDAAGSRELRGADAHRDAVLAQGRRHDRQSRLSLREAVDFGEWPMSKSTAFDRSRAMPRSCIALGAFALVWRNADVARTPRELPSDSVYQLDIPLVDQDGKGRTSPTGAVGRARHRDVLHVVPAASVRSSSTQC